MRDDRSGSVSRRERRGAPVADARSTGRRSFSDSKLVITVRSKRLRQCVRARGTAWGCPPHQDEGWEASALSVIGTSQTRTRALLSCTSCRGALSHMRRTRRAAARFPSIEYFVSCAEESLVILRLISPAFLARASGPKIANRVPRACVSRSLATGPQTRRWRRDAETSFDV